MKLLLVLFLFIFLGCEDIVEVAQKPDVKILSQKKIPAIPYGSGPIDTVVSAGDWEVFRSQSDIVIVSSDNLNSTNYYDVTFIRKGVGATKNGYFVHVKNVGNDTAFYLNVRINSTDGEKIIFSADQYLPNESDSKTVWLESGEDFIGTASIDFKSKE